MVIAYLGEYYLSIDLVELLIFGGVCKLINLVKLILLEASSLNPI